MCMHFSSFIRPINLFVTFLSSSNTLEWLQPSTKHHEFEKQWFLNLTIHQKHLKNFFSFKVKIRTSYVCKMQCPISEIPSILFHLYWDIIDIWHCISLRCIACWIDIYCKIMTITALVNTSNLSHYYYHFFFEIRILSRF